MKSNDLPPGILKGFQDVTLIHESERSSVFRGIRTEGSQPVILKVLKGDQSALAEVATYKNEYGILSDLDVPGVIKAYDLDTQDDSPVMVLEDFGGESLQQLTAERPLTLEEFFPLAVKACEGLADIHAADLIHKDINPGHIVANPDTGHVKIIGFGIASRQQQTTPSPLTHPGQLTGTLAYLSPEQTGRTNRSVDHRADLYSIGITFFEVLTGRLPFTATDPMELVHCHIAVNPPRAGEVRSDIPPILSDILTRLMGKNPEDRYQSALGVKADLEKCQIGSLDPQVLGGLEFELGQEDFSAELRIPEGLYGRESEVEALLHAFERASGGASELMLVAGYSGVGKTALVREVHRPMTEKSGLFISGKFDQFQRDIPYYALTHAFNRFCRLVLMEGAEAHAEWKSKILDAVGENGQVIINVIPELELVIGTQPPVKEVGPIEAQNRFQTFFLNFVGAICSKDHPLVLFVDDLQWVDSASLELLKSIMLDDEIKHLLIVGAYRDNEVDDGHPLIVAVDELRGRTGLINTIELGNLQPGHVNHLLQDSLSCEAARSRSLADLVFQKTAGNAFFTHQFVGNLYEEGLLRFDLEQLGWTWDVERIASRDITDNVVDLMATKISRLPERISVALQMAACVGSQFELKTLAVICERTRDETLSVLLQAVFDGLVFPLDEDYQDPDTAGESQFRFSHDRVQQAAYTLIDEEGRKEKHLEIARLLNADTDEADAEERIFDIVTHYRLSGDLLIDQAEKRQVAELNLTAGCRAKKSSAFHASAAYLEESLSVLGENKWEDHYQLTLDVYDELIDACYLKIQYDEVRSLYQTILHHARNEVGQCVAHKTMIMTLVAENQAREAIGLADTYLEKLQISFDTELTTHLSANEFLHLPLLEDEQQRAGLEIMMAISTPIIFSAPERLSSLFHTMLNIISRHGNSEVSSFAVSWYATLLCLAEKYQEGNVYGQLAVDLLNKFPSLGISSRIMNMQCAWIRHWESSVHDLIAPLKEYHLIGLQEGDFEWCLYCLGNYTLLLWGAGRPLEHYASEAEACIRLCESKNQEITYLICSLFAEAASNLMGESTNTTTLEGEWFSEENMLPKLEGNHQLLSFRASLRVTLCYLFGENDEAYRHAREGMKIRSSLNPHYLYTKISFYGGLSCIASLPGAEDEADREERLETLELFKRELKLWADSAPMNYRHQYDLLVAEESRMTNQPWEAVRSYEKAVAGARENQFVHDEALANELFGRFWLDQGNEAFGAVCIREAHDGYRRWGATAKVEQLKTLYPRLLTPPQSLTSGLLAESLRVGPERSPPHTSAELDLTSITKASQALSEEIVLGKLLTKMVHIVIENAGAERGVLLLPKGDEWFVEAEGYAGVAEVTVEQALPVKGNELVPDSLVHYAARTREQVILSDPPEESLFSRDTYIVTRRPKSALAFPLVYQGELTAILYLENSLTEGAFTPQRLDVLTLLSRQMAISIENSLLYRKLRASEELFRSLMEQSPLGIAVAMPDGKLTHVNAAWMGFLGFDEEEMEEVLANYNVLTDKQTVDLGIASSIRRAFAGEAVTLPPVEYALNRTTKDLGLGHIEKKPAWLQCQLSPVKNAKQETVFVVLTILDLTERKRAQREAREQREALARVGRATSMGQLAGSIAHELNQPLTGILSNAQAAELMIDTGQLDDDEAAEILAGIVSDAKRARDVMSNLRAVFGEQKAEFLSLDLNDTVEETKRLLHSEFVEQRITVTAECAPSIPMVNGNRIQLQQVLVNLILNGNQAMSHSEADDRRLHIATAFDGEEVRVWVEDHGPGIDVDKLDEIFEPLATWNPGGTGMGLAISNSIIQGHRGRMWAENRQEGGARVGFSLPVLKQDRQA